MNRLDVIARVVAGAAVAEDVDVDADAEFEDVDSDVGGIPAASR